MTMHSIVHSCLVWDCELQTLCDEKEQTRQACHTVGCQLHTVKLMRTCLRIRADRKSHGGTVLSALVCVLQLPSIMLDPRSREFRCIGGGRDRGASVPTASTTCKKCSASSSLTVTHPLSCKAKVLSSASAEPLRLSQHLHASETAAFIRRSGLKTKPDMTVRTMWAPKYP